MNIHIHNHVYAHLGCTYAHIYMQIYELYILTKYRINKSFMMR